MKRILLSVLITITHSNCLLSQSTSPAPYCTAGFDDENGDVPDAIYSVSLGTFTNASNAQFAFPHYVFYNNLPAADFIKGDVYPLTVIFDVHGSAGYGVWIDYNQNNTFEDSEKVSGSSGTNFLSISAYPAHTSVTQSITVPVSALTGPTRMRVRIVEDDNYTGAHGASILACNTGTAPADVMDWGETEDYTISLIESPVGIKESSKANNLIIYPNPVSTFLTLNQNVAGNLSYSIADPTGKIIQTGTVSASEKQITVSSLPEGIYFLKVLSGNGSSGQQKFIKTSE